MAAAQTDAKLKLSVWKMTIIARPLAIDVHVSMKQLLSWLSLAQWL